MIVGMRVLRPLVVVLVLAAIAVTCAVPDSPTPEGGRPTLTLIPPQSSQPLVDSLSQYAWPDTGAACCIDFEGMRGLQAVPWDVIPAGGKCQVEVETMHSFPPLVPMIPPSHVEIGTGPTAGGSGDSALINSVLLDLQLARRTRHVSMRVGYYGGQWELDVNGNWGRHADAPALVLASPAGTVGGVFVWFLPDPTDPRFGVLRAYGCIDRFQIGGQELAVDDVCTWIDDCKPKRSELMKSPFATVPAPQLQAFNGSRGVRLISWSNEPRRVLSVAVLGVVARQPARVQVSFYHSNSNALVASASAAVPVSATPVDVHVPFASPNQLAHGDYRLGVYFETAARATVQAMLSNVAATGLNHIEAEGYFAVDGPYSAPANAPPTIYDPTGVPWLIITTDCRN